MDTSANATHIAPGEVVVDRDGEKLGIVDEVRETEFRLRGDADSLWLEKEIIASRAGSEVRLSVARDQLDGVQGEEPRDPDHDARHDVYRNDADQTAMRARQREGYPSETALPLDAQEPGQQ